jgi:C1A family cysteine protease
MSTITTVKGCLLDRDFRVYDYKNKSWKAPPKPVAFTEVKSKLPTFAGVTNEYVIPEHTPISAQGGAGTCVANAMCDGCEMLLGLEHGASKVVQLSRRHLYWTSRYTHRMTDEDKGTFLSAAAWQMQEVGVMPEEYFPYSDALADLVVSPPLEAYTMASENRVTGHFRIVTRGDELLDDIEQCIRSNNPVGFGTAVADDFKRYRGGGAVFPRPTGGLVGRHAMLIVGVRYRDGRREFLLRNSWGGLWGDGGHVWVDQDYITWRESEDFWMLTRMQLID